MSSMWNGISPFWCFSGSLFCKNLMCGPELIHICLLLFGRRGTDRSSAGRFVSGGLSIRRHGMAFRNGRKPMFAEESTPLVSPRSVKIGCDFFRRRWRFEGWIVAPRQDVHVRARSAAVRGGKGTCRRGRGSRLRRCFPLRQRRGGP